MARPKIGLALGSGAARGWSHIGVIEALLALDIVPDIVCGTSMGALVGAAYVTGRLDGLRSRIEGFGWREILSMLDVRLTTGGLIEGARIEAFLTELGITGPIERAEKPFAAVATNLATGREVWLQTGPIDRAVRASIGMPGVFSPTRLGEAWLLDGGLVNPVPVSLCRALGADIIIAVDVNSDLVGRRFTGPAAAGGPPQPEMLKTILAQLPNGVRTQLAPLAANLLQPGPATPGYFEVLANAINIMQDQISRARLAGEPPHVLLRPELGDMQWMDFQRATPAIAEGRACVGRSLDALRRYIPAAA
jgi:NTE family protein